MSSFLSLFIPVPPEDVESDSRETDSSSDDALLRLPDTSTTATQPAQRGGESSLTQNRVDTTSQEEQASISSAPPALSDGRHIVDVNMDESPDDEMPPPLLDISTSSGSEHGNNDEDGEQQDILDIEMIAGDEHEGGLAQQDAPQAFLPIPLAYQAQEAVPRPNRRMRMDEEDEEEAARPTASRRTSRSDTAGGAGSSIPAPSGDETTYTHTTPATPAPTNRTPFGPRGTAIGFFSAFFDSNGRLVQGQQVPFPGFTPLPPHLNPFAPRPVSQSVNFVSSGPRLNGNPVPTNPLPGGPRTSLPPIQDLNLPGLSNRFGQPPLGQQQQHQNSGATPVTSPGPLPSLRLNDFLNGVFNRASARNGSHTDNDNDTTNASENGTGANTAPVGTAGTNGDGQSGATGDPGVDSNQAERLRQQFMTGFALLMGTLRNVLDPDDKEDPERAKRLIAALERVPEGLVSRLERVNGTGGDHGSAGCAVCLDSLLDREGEGFNEVATSDDYPPPQADGSAAPAPAPDAATPSAMPDNSTAASSTVLDIPPDAIVALPCAHVFHVSCLIPWFSRPRQKTCPTCRFDIDPENLTYVYRPRARSMRERRQAQDAARTQQGSGEGAAGATAPPSAEGPPAPAPPNLGNATHGPQLPFPRMALPRESVNFNMGNLPFTIQIVLEAIPMNDGADGTNGGANGGAVPPPGGDGAPPTMQPPPIDFARFFTPFARSQPTGPAPTPNQQPAHPQPAEHLASAGPDEQQPLPPTSTLPDLPDLPGLRAPQSGRRREWTLPAPPGSTLRQRVEKREREAGWRCCDVSCGAGPSDEDPIAGDRAMRKQVGIHPLVHVQDREGAAICEHTFHPECLVSAERVAGYGGAAEADGNVRVSCPVCRAGGCVSRDDWAIGTHDLELAASG